MEDIGAEDDLNSSTLSREVSEEKNFSIWPRVCFCGILVTNMAAFCSYLSLR